MKYKRLEVMFNNKSNNAIVSFVAFYNIYALFAVPALITYSGIWWSLTLLPFLFLHTVQWGLIHEAIHKHLHPDAKINEYQGRLMSVLLGASFHGLRFGHLMHHKLNRQWQSELVKQKSFMEVAAYYFNLLGGLYIVEVIGSVMMAVMTKKQFMAFASKQVLSSHPEVLVPAERIFYDKGAVKMVRKDMAITFILYTASFIAYGAYYPVLLGLIISRALMISFMDNIYHYDTNPDNSLPGKDLKMPRMFSRMILNSNYHGTHHRNPQLPWRELPLAHMAQGRQYEGRFLEHGIMQFKGPLVVA